MHICHIIASYGTGGMEGHVVTLCDELSKEHQVSVLVPPWFTEKFSSRVRVVPMRGLLGNRFSPVVRFFLWRQLKRLNPDIVHAHGGKAARMIVMPFLFARFKRVATVHGVKNHFLFLRCFDRIISVSSVVAEQLGKIPTDIILNGVAHAGNFPTGSTAPHSPKRVIAVGRLAPVKGFDVLLNAWVDVKDAQLTLVGDGPERKNLEALAGKLNIKDRVNFLGTRSDVPALLADSDLMVISSRREGMPLVFAEALHTRRQVVSTAVGGMRDMLPPEFLVPPGNPEALAATINRALENWNAGKTQFEPLWKMAKTELTVEAMTRKTIAVYAQVLNVA
jgi:glycosyltransferase involved in cell wall biosynthesis